MKRRRRLWKGVRNYGEGREESGCLRHTVPLGENYLVTKESSCSPGLMIH